VNNIEEFSFSLKRDVHYLMYNTEPANTI
jgi:hypothetical protein